ncbi:hypothetical protein TNIN_119721 [Trichonephila inaurata madagascariensis]|uniref:Uncharacterized protein n=1 Tax=Trichonephila inaurata madagascariensis TaxID=2747483 RepID=A0A8X6I3U9_9ARAC|nr:hypothetical protein TNIN_119721 [Trichonephila inaurata madagascariensis]
MSSNQSLDLSILTHQKLVQFNQHYGDKEKIPELLKFVEDTTADKERLVEANEDYQFYVIQPKGNKQIKILIKDLPCVTLPTDISIDLEELGYTITLLKKDARAFSPRPKEETPEVISQSVCGDWS